MCIMDIYLVSWHPSRSEFIGVHIALKKVDASPEAKIRIDIISSQNELSAVLGLDLLFPLLFTATPSSRARPQTQRNDTSNRK